MRQSFKSIGPSMNWRRCVVEAGPARADLRRKTVRRPTDERNVVPLAGPAGGGLSHLAAVHAGAKTFTSSTIASQKRIAEMHIIVAYGGRGGARRLLLQRRTI